MTFEEYQDKWMKLSQQQYTLREEFIKEHNEKYKEFLNKKVEVFEKGKSKGIGYFYGFWINDYNCYSVAVKFNKVRKDGSMALTSAGIYVYNIDDMELKLVEE